jgi:cytochrome c-type biogenesis protein CcmH/NrfG
MNRLAKFLLPVFVLTALLLSLAACSSDPKVRKQKFLDNGNKLFAKGEFKQAALYYRRALREDATFAEGYYRLGLTAIRLGNWADAIGSLQRAFTLDPNNSDAGAKLAEIYIIAATQDPKRAKQFKLEIKDVSDRLLQRDPKSFDGLRLAAYLDLAEGQPADAIEKYKKANEVKPDQPEVTIPLAQALINSNQTAEAEKLALGQIEKNKTQVPFYDLLYTMYVQSQKRDEAERILKKKVENIGNPELNLQLASHYFSVQKRAEMEAALQKVAGNPQVANSYARTGDFYAKTRGRARNTKRD